MANGFNLNIQLIAHIYPIYAPLVINKSLCFKPSHVGSGLLGANMVNDAFSIDMPWAPIQYKDDILPV